MPQSPFQISRFIGPRPTSMGSETLLHAHPLSLRSLASNAVGCSDPSPRCNGVMGDGIATSFLDSSQISHGRRLVARRMTLFAIHDEESQLQSECS